MYQTNFQGRCPFTGNRNGSMEQKVYSAFKMFASPTLDGGGGGGGGGGGRAGVLMYISDKEV